MSFLPKCFTCSLLTQYTSRGFLEIDKLSQNLYKTPPKGQVYAKSQRRTKAIDLHSQLSSLIIKLNNLDDLVLM